MYMFYFIFKFNGKYCLAIYFLKSSIMLKLAHTKNNTHTIKHKTKTIKYITRVLKPETSQPLIKKSTYKQ